MADIVNSMFGFDPDAIKQQRMMDMYNKSIQMAQLDPYQRANAMMGQAGAGIAMLGAQAMGLKTREEQIAETRQAVLQNMEQGDPDSILAAAQRLNQAGDTKGAMLLAQNAQELKRQQAEIAYKDAMAEKALRETPVNMNVQEIGVEGKPSMRQKAILMPNGEWKPVGSPYLSKQESSSEGGMKPSDELKWMNQHSKDYDAAKQDISSSDRGISKVSSITSNPKFGYLFGGYTEKAISKLAPGEIAALNSQMDSLKSELMTAGLNAMRKSGGVGSITEKEWPIFERLIASLDSKMDEKSARARFSEIETYFKKTKEDSADTYHKKWSKKENYYDPSIMEMAKEKRSPMLPSTPAYSDKEKEARYQAWKAQQKASK